MGAAITYQWDFGVPGINTDTSSLQMPTFTYFSANAPGNYSFTVSLVLSEAGCIDTVTKVVTLTILPNSLPTASMISLGVGPVLSAPYLHCNAVPNTPFTLSVQNTSTNVGANGSYTIHWGDNMTSNITQPPPFTTTTHSYAQMGLYDIELIATAQNGCVDSIHYPFFNGRNPAVGIGISPNEDLCAPTTILFENTPGMENNPPGTIYIYSVDDGDSTTLDLNDTLIHTIPLQIFDYTFLHSSCDPAYSIDGVSPPETFVVNVAATNLCGTVKANLTPSISSSVVADFSIDTVGCVGDPYCLINTSDINYYWNSQQQMCFDNAFLYWQISGGSFSLESGSLGSSILFQSGTDTVCVSYNTPGIFTVRLILAPSMGSPCPPDTIFKTICILPAPVASFTKAQSGTCAPGAMLTINNTSNTLTNCRPARYHWDILFLGSDCDSLGGWTLLNGTDTNSIIPPKIGFTKPGKYLIRLTVSNMCGSDMYEDSVNIAGVATSVITAIDDACQPLTVIPSAESTNACNGGTPSLIWLVQNPLPPHNQLPPIPGPSPGTFTYNLPGNYTITLQTVSGAGCTTSTTSESFTVFPLPTPPIITSNSPVCEGSNLVFTISNPNPNYMYEWPAVPVVTGNIWTIQNASPANSGTYVVTITDVSTGLMCTRTQTVTALVYSRPPLSIVQDTSICIGQSVTLQALPSSYMNYDWALDSQFLNVTSGPTVVATPPVGTWHFSVTVTNNATENCQNADTVTVIVNSLPTIVVSIPDTACVGSVLQLQATANHTGTGVWSPQPLVSPDGMFLASTPGTYVVMYTFTDSVGCKSSTSVSVCVQPAPAASFTLSTLPLNQCGPLQVTTTNTSNTLTSCFGARYLWEVQFDSAECHSGMGMWNFVSGNANSQAPVFNFTQSGHYTIKLTVSNACGSSTATRAVEVGQAPQVQIDSIPNNCGNALLDLSTQSLGCNSNITTYSWKVDNVVVSSLPNPVDIPVNGVGTHTVMVTVTNLCGSATDMVTFDIQGAITPQVTLLDDFGCISFTTGVNNTTTGTIESLLWTVTPATGATISNPTASSPTFTFSAIDTFIVQLEASNGACGSFTWQDTVIASGRPNVSLSPIGDTCLIPGTVFTPVAFYDVEGVVDTNFIDTFSWTVTPQGYMSNLPNPTDIPYGNPGLHTVSISVTNQCGTDLVSTTYTVLQPPNADAQLSAMFGCAPDTIDVINSSTGDNLTYTWTVTPPATQIINPTSATPRFVFNTIGVYTITMDADNLECTNSTWSEVVTISDVPSVTLAPIGDTCLIPNTSFTPVADYSVQGITGTNFIDAFSWTVAPQGYMSNLPNPMGIDYGNPGLHTVSISVSNQCGTDLASTTYNVLQPPSADAQLSATFGCAPDTIDVTNNSTGDNLTYSWSVTPPATQIINPTSATPRFVFNTIGVYTITMDADNLECTNSTWSEVVTISDVPSVTLAPIGDTCQIPGTSFTPVADYSVQGITGTNFIDAFSWTVTPQGYMSTLPNPMGIDYGNPGLHTVSISVSNQCGTDSASTTYTVLQPPSADAQLSATFGCVPDTIGVTNNSTGDNLTYSWTVTPPATQIINPTSATPQFVFDVPGIYDIMLSAGNSECAASLWNETVTISGEPSVTLSSIGDTCLIPGTTFSPVAVYSVLGISGAAFIDSVVWTITDTTGFTLTYDSLNPTGIPYGIGGLHTVWVKVFNQCGADSASTTYRVLLPPNAIAQLDTTYACAPDTISVTNFSTGDDLQYNWLVSPPATQIINPMSPTPQFVFDNTGIFTITLTASNPECANSVWSQVVNITGEPSVTLSGIGDTCLIPGTTFSPVATYSVEGFPGSALIDSVIWTVTDTANVTLTYNTFDPIGIPYGIGGIHTVWVKVFTPCGADSASTTYRVLEPPSANAQLSATFGCAPDTIDVTNNSTGDNLTYSWTVTPPATQIINPTSATPRFVFNTIGVYTITLDADNLECTNSTWSGVVTISDVPSVILAPIGDTCLIPGTSFTPIADYSVQGITGTNFIDAFSWTVTPQGYTSSLPDPMGIPYGNAGLHTVSISVSNQCGTDLASTTYNVLQPPSADAQLSATFGCAPDTIDVTNNSTGDNLTYSWTVTPPATQIINPTSATPRFVFNTIGVYTITMDADNLECTNSTWSEVVTISDVPSVTLSPIGDTCLISGTSFTPVADYSVQGITGTNFIDAFSWTVTPQGYMSSLPDPMDIPYGNAGLHTVTISVFNQCGTNSDSTSYRVLQPPAAMAQLDTTFACLPATVGVSNNSLGDDLLYSWSISPAAQILNPTSATPQFVFNTVGTYTVSMKAFNSECDTSQWSQIITISDVPGVTLAGIPDSLCEGSGVIVPIPNFSLQDYIDDYLWTFTGSTGIQTSTVVLPGPIPYDTSGLFVIKITVSNRCGASSDSTFLQIIEPPLINATVDQTMGCAPATINIANQPINGVTYTWDFGDGSTSTNPTPGSHLYPTPGVYPFSVTVTDAFGCTRTAVVAVIDIHPTPVAGFTLDQPEPCGLPQNICLQNTSIGATLYDWTFGSGAQPATSTQSNPCLAYTSEGTDTIWQVVSNQFACKDSTFTVFTTYDKPVALFASSDTAGCEDLLVEFINNSLHADFSIWEYNGLIDSTLNPSYTFTEPGAYTISLIVGNASGCRDTLEVNSYLEVWPRPIAGFTFEEDPNEWPRTFQFTDQSISTEPLSYVWVFDDGDSSTLQNPKHRYRVLSEQFVTQWIENQYGCSDSASARLAIDSLGDLFVPNILEPASLSLEKQVFLPKGYNLKEYHIGVFTRTGQLVWESELLEDGHPKESWDGTLKGVPLPSGVFVWKVFVANFKDGHEWKGMLDEELVKRRSNFLYLLR